VEADSAGFSDGNAAAVRVFFDGRLTGFDNSWIKRGFNVATFLPVHHDFTSTAAYDVYASASASHAMLAALMALPDGTLVTIGAHYEQRVFH